MSEHADCSSKQLHECLQYGQPPGVISVLYSYSPIYNIFVGTIVPYAIICVN